MKKVYSNKLHILIFLLPALILFFGVLIAPIGASFYYSLFDWKGIGANKVFIWFQNYKELFTSKPIGFMRALRNSLLLAALSVFLQLPLALALALTLGKRIKGERAFLSVYFMPVLISTVVIGQLWLKIYNPDYGILHVALRAVGLDNLAQIWLGNVSTALPAVFVPILWQYVGYHMIIQLAAMRNIDSALYEAAELDGATGWQEFKYVTFPLIKPILKIDTVLIITGSLKYYDLVAVMTNGGPNHATEVMSTYMYYSAFNVLKYGYACAIGVILMLLCMITVGISNAVFKTKS